MARTTLRVEIISHDSVWVWLGPLLTVAGPLIIAAVTLYVMKRTLSESARQNREVIATSDRRELEVWRREEVLRIFSGFMVVCQKVEAQVWACGSWPPTRISTILQELQGMVLALESQATALKLLEPVEETLSQQALSLVNALSHAAQLAADRRNFELGRTRANPNEVYQAALDELYSLERSFTVTARNVIGTPVAKTAARSSCVTSTDPTTAQYTDTADGSSVDRGKAAQTMNTVEDA